MTDPAYEAAWRAMRHDPHQGVSLYDIAEIRVNSAREALKPIREKCDVLRAAAGERLHPTDPDYDIGNAFDDGVLSLIDELAPLIYATEELRDE